MNKEEKLVFDIKNLQKLHSDIQTEIRLKKHRLTTIEDTLSTAMVKYNRLYNINNDKTNMTEVSDAILGKVELMEVASRMTNRFFNYKEHKRNDR